MREGEEKGGESSVEDEKSKRIKNVKFMHRGGFCFTYGTLFECVYFTLRPKEREGRRGGRLIHGTHLWTATVTLEKQII